MSINLFENQLNTARQNVQLTRAALGEVMLASQRNPNNADLAAQVEQTERELIGWEQKLKSTEIAASYTAQEHDSAAAVAAREAAVDAAKSAHNLLVTEHRAYIDGQIKVYRVLADLSGGDLKTIQGRLSALCTTLAKAATRGVPHSNMRASEKYMHVRVFLLGDELPEMKNADKAIVEAEHSHNKLKEWADRALAEALAAISAVPTKD